MNIFQKIFNKFMEWMDSYYSRDYLKQIDDLKAELKISGDWVTTVDKETESLNTEIETLKAELESKEKDSELADYWDNKYTKGSITYNGRSLPYSDVTIKVPVSVLITPSDPFIIADLKKWGYLNTNEDFETLIPKIYKKIKSAYYHYETDLTVWGNIEVWEIPFEMRAKAELSGGTYQFDCDSWANFQVSYYRAVGLPAWRVRAVAGKTRGGEGHDTVSVFSLKDNRWHHQNSTYGKTGNNISDYPWINDTTDITGLETVWFSYNDKFSFYQFKDDLPSGIETNKK